MPMKLLKTFALTWWQAGIFKVGMLALGIVIGAYWQETFCAHLPLLIVIAAASLAYVSYVWWRQ
ncbi:MAG: hypothetical protein P4L57_03945 [Rhizomicrobium sp.]|nr:hypothetical protein [Rhizomicrobium sp.]